MQARNNSLFKYASLALGPLLCLTIIFVLGPSVKSWTLGIAFWMIIWWVTEATSLFVTAFLPIILFPILNLHTIEATAEYYADPIIFLFLGGFIFAIGLERSGLHQRFAYGILKLTGQSLNGIVLGFLLSTSLLSMWISNTATTMLMLPIAVSVINVVKEQAILSKIAARNFSISLMLCIAYAASIGGMATLIGTPPNTVFAGFMRKSYGIEIDFIEWMKIGVPIMLVLLAVLYYLLTRTFYPSQALKEEKIVIQAPVSETKLTNKEKITLIVFVILACGWIFKSLLNNFLGINLTDAGIAMGGSLLLFLIPSSVEKNDPVLIWRDMKELPFGILFLFGGGIALANALSEAGILQVIATRIETFSMATWEIVLLLTFITVILTEVMSNVALVLVFLPIVGAMAKGLGIPVEYLAIPVTLAASSGFMLPMSTPPNVIAFSSGHLKMKDMLLIGLVLDAVSIIVIFIFSWIGHLG